jgi:hypothetical protein
MTRDAKFLSLLSLITFCFLPSFLLHAKSPGNVLLKDKQEASVNIRTYNYPTIAPESRDYRVRINGQDAFAYYTSAGTFVAFESDADVEVEVWSHIPAGTVDVYPKRYNIEPEIDGHYIRFTMPVNSKLLLEAPDKEQLFFYADKPVDSKPDPDAEGVHYFREGQIYEAGEIVLGDDEMVYIEGGAVVRGNIRATSARNVKIAGKGVLDHSYYADRQRRRHILLEDCLDANINDIIMIEPQTWMITLYHSDRVTIDGIKQLGAGHGSDGVDIVGTDNVMIRNSMLRNGDDCVVVKSFKRPQYVEATLNEWDGVTNVMVTGCAVQANGGGQAFEIGHELMRGPIQNIVFIDNDVMGVHGQGGVFGIHNSDHAHIQNVRYEKIRVDHFYNKLVDLRIIESRWTRDENRGSAQNILFKDIDVTTSIYNPGYSISLIGGYDENHKIKNVTFDNFRLDGVKVTHADQLDLFLKQTENIVFK